MRPETWFKLAFAVAFVFAATIAGITARQATRRHGGSLNQLTHEVRGLVFIRAALGIVFYFALMLWLFWPRAVPWSYFRAPMTLRWAAVVLLVPVLAFFAWSFRTLGTNYRGGVGLYEGHELVSIGPYRWIRHPIYAAFVAIMLLVALLSASWVLGLAGLLLVTSIAVIRIPVEEGELHERFGRDWERYRERTGRILPRL